MSIFTRIIDGEIPGRFVWSDAVCVGLIDVAPHAPGHTLIIPRVEIDRFTDLDDETAAHIFLVAKRVGKAQISAFGTARSMLMIAGLDVPHTHLHVIPADSQQVLDFASARTDVTGQELDDAATKLREALVSAGWGEFVPKDMGSC